MPPTNATDAETLCVFGAEIIVVWSRLIFNAFTVLLAAAMIYFICERPSLHSNTFNTLFLSSFVVDILANLSRMALKYLPALFCQHQIVTEVLGFENPLATMVNASEWYLSYATICCGFFFNLDHMILVVFPKYYSWMRSRMIKWAMLLLTWLVPLVWILPMIGECCRSKFLDKTTATVFINDRVQTIYDTVDMLFESLLYVPIVFIFNLISTCVLNRRYLKCHPSSDPLASVISTPMNGDTTFNYPMNGDDGDDEYIRVRVRSSHRHIIMERHRIVDELNLSLINLIDQMVDAIGVVFYMLFWACNNEWLSVENAALWLSLYDVCWEVGTVCQPYLFLLIFPQIRKQLIEFYTPNCGKHRLRRRRILRIDTNVDINHIS